jgi:hypothetical protein
MLNKIFAPDYEPGRYAGIRFFLGGGRPRHASKLPAMGPDALGGKGTYRVRCYQNCYPTRRDDPGWRRTKDDSRAKKWKRLGSLKDLERPGGAAVNELGNRCSIRLSYGTKTLILLYFYCSL